MAEIRLTWWRELLDEAFGPGPVRRHPTAEALARAVRRRRLPRAPLEAMIDGQIQALGQSELSQAQAAAWAEAVEGSAARLAAMILDPNGPGELAAPAGRAWGLAQLRRAGLAAAVLDVPLRQALAEAGANASKLSARAIPAALPARLARFDLAGKTPGALAKRISLVLAVATGRI